MADMNWTAVLTALIGAAAGATAPLIMQYSGGRRERESVRAAILAEISSLADIIERRGYEHDLWCEQANLESRLQAAMPGEEVEAASLHVPIPKDYNLIYRQNCQRLGVLAPREASQVVQFYQLLQSVIADISPGGLSMKALMIQKLWEKQCESSARQWMSQSGWLAPQIYHRV